MNERMKFISRRLEGESISALCREFGISRKTGHKIWNRYQNKGLDGLFDETRKPFSSPNQTPDQIVNLILKLKASRPSWGAVKLRAYLIRKHCNTPFPSRNTFHNILLRNSLVEKKHKRKYKAVGTNLRVAKEANDLWCTDFKGQFLLGNKKYCYPLTITDQRTRYLISCEALESTKENPTFPVFEEAFEKYGIPHAIRTDNGVPFSCSRALLGLSKLSVWWLRLGIEIERIRPGNPQENGRHERMHLTLKKDLLKRPAPNFLGQQEVFDKYIDDFNNERPHQAIDNKSPGRLYKHSKIKYKKNLAEIKYPHCEKVITVFQNGKINLKPKKSTHICSSLIGQPIGIAEVEEDIWRLQFLDIILGHYDANTEKFAPMTEITRL